MERLTELKYYITKLDAKIKNMQERIEKMAFDCKEEVGIEFLASTVSYFKELREYMQLEEQGLLLRLPCKVESIVYYINGKFILEYEVTGFSVDRTGVWLMYVKHHADENDTTYVFNFDVDKIGKTVFLTKAEAEQKLKEMEDK